MESFDGSSRDTSVLVVLLETSEVYILVSLTRKKDTQVIYVDPTTGSLRYLGKTGFDLFNSEEEALNYITDGSRLMCKTTTYARAILGYAALGNFGLLLVATKLTATVPNLPGGGCVYTMTESQWIKVQLQNPQPQGKGELKNVQELTELDIDGKHYFCATRDITRPFPSPMTCHNPDNEFVWNGWFSKPFSEIGLAKHCVVLLQDKRNHVTVGEYRLPEVRAGIALYFDFPRPIQARRLIFRLLGDVAAFADDIAEQDDSNFRAHPLASGLSLSNRVKLYYYADPYELGKLGSLSAV